MQQSAPPAPALQPEGQPMPQGMPGLPQAPVEEDQPAYAPYQEEDPAIGHKKLIAWIDKANIAEELDESLLGALGARCAREYDIDLGTRSEWEERSKAAMDLAMQIAKAKQHPWPGAANIVYPLMTVAAVQFAARSYPAIIQNRNVVKGVVVGPDKGIPQIGQDGSPVVMMTPQGPQPQWAQPPGSKRERARKIGEHMSWQLLCEMKEWEEGTDKLLHILPVIGCCFRKSYFDPAMGRNISALVMAQNVVINYWAPSLDRVRISEDIKLYPSEIEEMVRAGLFIEHEYGTAEDSAGDEDAPHEFVEQHRTLDLDEDGYPEPYVVTYHKRSHKIARIKARYDADGVHINRQGQVAKIEPIQYYTKYDFLPSLDGGIYGTGYGQLLGPINAAVNTSLNMMFDAAHLQTMGGGFVGRGLSMNSGSLKFKLGEWKVVNAPGQTVRESIVPLQHAGPSAQLYQLLVFLIEAGKEVASVKDALTGEAAAATMQPTTLMALIEQGLKVFTAIYKRIHRGLGEEYSKLYKLNQKYLQYQTRFQIGDEWKTITKDDYAKGGGVEPISDPAMVSDMQRAAKAQFLQGFRGQPDVNQPELLTRIWDAAQVDEPEKLHAQQQPPNPELIAKAAEMELKGHEMEAKIASLKFQQLKDLTQAVLNLANADKVVGDGHLAWIEQHIDAYRAQMESLMQPAGKGQEGEGDDGGEGEAPQRLAPPPGGLQGPLPGMSDQLPGDGSMAAPFPDARQSRSGNWYPGHPATARNIGGM